MHLHEAQAQFEKANTPIGAFFEVNPVAARIVDNHLYELEQTRGMTPEERADWRNRSRNLW